jgi:hypothetical protein
MFYTYLWLREDGTPYYVGKGKGNRGFTSKGHGVHRPISKDHIVLHPVESESEAFETEIALIWYYGRKDNGTGCLRNLTDGGEGTSGKPKESRERISKALKGNKHGLGHKHTAEVRAVISEARKGNQNGKCNKGRKRGRPWNFGTARSPEERRIRHREACIRSEAKKKIQQKTQK